MPVVMRAKMRIDTVTKNEWSETLKLQAVYANTTNKEDNTFAEATPSATLELQITNKELHGRFKPGQKFYVDFTEADLPPAVPATEPASA